MRNEKEIGKAVRQLRGTESLRSFAQKCDVSHTTIDNLEKGIDFRTGKPTQAKMVTLQKIARACNVPISHIVGEEEKPSEPEGTEGTVENDRRLFTLWNQVSEANKPEILNLMEVFLRVQRGNVDE